MNHKTPTVTEYKMDLEENEVVHGRPLLSFSIKLETEITGEAPLVKRIGNHRARLYLSSSCVREICFQ